MHEAGLIEDVIGRIARQTPKAGARVVSLRLRCGPFVSGEALRQSLQMLSRGTLLEAAQLEIEQKGRASILCKPCGWPHLVQDCELGGHVFVCEKCGQLSPLPPDEALEVVDIVWSRS